ncbi:4-hydroxybenzoyl-CoA thioesterase [Novosphingobium fluoreni]|uniref:4-hydroxybenzoyl-CoA thioesterase n=1 Tax=Novosphingobium fluoreni TaxID=1391222 RepID=A0A7W6BVA3_9SPHN|nr:thioesterase family protein [Novosphingobium fluoreni]MBB3938629.1 4-hydroxybenzoyl-CoA thioesterase [Novosphingobium fluoreni]
MIFETSTQVRFAHVDPAGIVFYPRYFEMVNGAVEDWFAQSLGASFKTMHIDGGYGTPTVKLEVTFLSPSRLGDELTIRITPRVLGRTSCHINVVFTGEGRDRLNADIVLVCMDLNDHKARPWPDFIREKIAAQLVEAPSQA